MTIQPGLLVHSPRAALCGQLECLSIHATPANISSVFWFRTTVGRFGMTRNLRVTLARAMRVASLPIHLATSRPSVLKLNTWFRYVFIRIVSPNCILNIGTSDAPLALPSSSQTTCASIGGALDCSLLLTSTMSAPESLAWRFKR